MAPQNVHMIQIHQQFALLEHVLYSLQVILKMNVQIMQELILVFILLNHKNVTH